MMHRHLIIRGDRRSGEAFTLIECMYAMFLIALVLPAVNLGIAAATKGAGNARDRAQAAILAQSKLSELIASEQWSGGAAMSGDFGPQWPNYRWQATASAWVNDTQGVGLQQLDVQVSWPAANPRQSLTVSSLVYLRGQSTSG